MSELTEGGCGVCLGGYDGETPEFFHSEFHKARNSHKCYECGERINPGEKYERVSGKWDGAIEVYRFCAICSEISRCLSCEGRCFGSLWDDIHESLFPQMTTGCLAKLETAAAKEHLVKMWREWKFA